MYEASGKVLGTYEKENGITKLREVPLLGSSRLGMDRVDVIRSNTPLAVTSVYSRVVGSKNYELTDHLGNVRAVVGDIKVPSGASFMADLRSSSDYYPFGMALPARGYQSAEYRYGYNGQEKDDEIKGEGNSYSFEYRIHDPRIGRFLSVDPLTKKYPFYTPYSFCGNRVIDAVELEGLEPGVLFPNMDAAATNFAQLFNDNSIRLNKEIATYIYSSFDEESNIFYSYSVPFMGTNHSAELSSTDIDALGKEGKTVVAWAHTHAASTAGLPLNQQYGDNEFSGVGTNPPKNDAGASHTFNIDGYVATPNGSLIKYELSTQKTQLLSTQMPSDAGPGTGAVGAGISAMTTTLYCVQKGDTYKEIAKRMMTTEAAILSENKIQNPQENPSVGTTLNITN